MVYVVPLVELPESLVVRIAAVSPEVQVLGPRSLAAAEVILASWRQVTPEVLRSAPRLRWIHMLSAGAILCCRN